VALAQSLRYHAPLLNAFRDAFEKGENRRERVVGAHYTPEVRRRGLNESQLRQFVVDDLVSVIGTIDMQSCSDLSGLEYASRSIINYGIREITHLTSEDADLEDVERNILVAIRSFEPRISKDSIVVERKASFNEVEQRLLLSIYAEISNTPMNIPVDFVAEVDFGSGKVEVRQAPGPS